MPDQNAGVAGSSENSRGATPPGDDVTDGSIRPQGARAVSGVSARAGSPWRVRNWRLRTKIVAVLIVPTLTALALGGLRAREDLARANDFRQTVNQVDLARNVTLVVHELQKERTLAVDNVARNRTNERALLDQQINRVDRARGALSEAAKRVETNDENARNRYNRGLQRLAGLDALRQATSNTEYPHLAVKSAYTSIIESLVQLGREVNTAVTDRDLLREATTVQALSEAKEFASQENASLQIAAVLNSFPSGLLDDTRAAQASFGAAQAAFRANATPQELQFYSDTVSGPEVDDRERIKATAFNRALVGNGTLGIQNQQLVADGNAMVDKLRKVEDDLLGSLRQRADELALGRTSSAWTNAGIVFVLLVVALILMILVTRSILKPLRVLRTNALDIAYTRLPETVQRILADPDPVAASKHAVEPMPVFTREETGEVARSFDAVHEQAVRMAAEQALLRDNVNSIFVNLSRRSQALVERQLNLIDRLEQDEQDPDQLASLFELDHLATRMRRNSESLLVLSGTGLSRQLTRPVPSADVVGAAVSEVEQYARVDVLSAPDVAVQGRAVNDLVHLIAELLDNATSFSEPEKKVTVRMAVTRKKELAIQITDQGVGMPADEIDSANRRLADPPDMDVSVTRRMGLYVVARLAQRHNIQVRLRDNEDIDGGLIARIIVPASLIQSSRGVQPTNLTPTGGIPIPAPTDTNTSQRPLPPRSGGSLASAFTGSLPRMRPDGLLEDSDPNLASFPPYASPDYPPLVGNATNGNSELTGRWAPERLDHPPDPEPPTQVQSLQHEQPEDPDPEPDPDPLSLFGDAFAEQKAAREVQEAVRYPVPEPSPEVNRDLDAPTERLPIYEAVLSQWFEEGDSEKRVPGSEGASTPHDAGTAAPDQAHAAPAPTPAPQPQSQPQPAASPEFPPVVDVHAPEPEPEPEEVPEPETAADEPARTAWQSPGDDGWQAAQNLGKAKPEVTTPAGLPKRVPKAQLIPGSAPSRPGSPQQSQRSPVLPPRSADVIRGRMSSFQQGIRRGRHAMVDAYAGDQDSVDSSQDEEQE